MHILLMNIEPIFGPRETLHIGRKGGAHIWPKGMAHMGPNWRAHIGSNGMAHIRPKGMAHIGPKGRAYIGPKKGTDPSIASKVRAHIDPKGRAHTFVIQRVDRCLCVHCLGVAFGKPVGVALCDSVHLRSVPGAP